MAHPPRADLPRRLPFREQPTAEALAFDRWRFGAAIGFDPGEQRIVRPGAFGLLFDLPEPVHFDPDAVSPEGIACLSVCGPLEHHSSWWANYEDIEKAVAAALAHEAVRALVLKIDSPGGVCAGMGQLHRAILRLRATAQKLVVAYVCEQACSAAYNLASACSEIWLPREASLGSIGVILCTTDETKMLAELGISVRYVTTGARKADMHPGNAVTDDVIRVAQESVDKLGGHFFRAVARARGTTPDAVASLEAAIFSGENAVAVGLADGVADWGEFFDTLRGGLGGSVGTPGGAMRAAA